MNKYDLINEISQFLLTVFFPNAPQCSVRICIFYRAHVFVLYTCRHFFLSGILPITYDYDWIDMKYQKWFDSLVENKTKYKSINKKTKHLQSKHEIQWNLKDFSQVPSLFYSFCMFE